VYAVQGKCASSSKLPAIAAAAGPSNVDASLNCGMAWVNDKSVRLKREDGGFVNVNVA
jgi:hypothetical protein